MYFREIYGRIGLEMRSIT